MMCSIAYAASTVVMVRVGMKCLRMVNLSVAVMMLVKVVSLWSRLSGRATSKSVDQDVRGPSDTVEFLPRAPVSAFLTLAICNQSFTVLVCNWICVTVVART